MILLGFHCFSASFKFGLSLPGNEFECLISFLEATNLREKKKSVPFAEGFALNVKRSREGSAVSSGFDLHLPSKSRGGLSLCRPESSSKN